MVEVMNHRATIIANKQIMWTKESDFNLLVLWTRSATPCHLLDFTNDPTGDSCDGKKYFLSVLGRYISTRCPVH